MATHQQSTKHLGSDPRFAGIIAAIEAKEDLVRQRVEAELRASTSDALGLLHSKVREPQKNKAASKRKPLFGGIAQFDVPSARNGKAASESGKVPIHFDHSTLTNSIEKSGAAIRKSRAAVHSIYIERDDAVARTDLGGQCLELVKDTELIGSLDVTGALGSAITNPELSNDYETAYHHPAEGVDFDKRGPTDSGAASIERASTPNSLCNMSIGCLVPDSLSYILLLQPPTDDDLAAVGATRDVLRHPRAGARKSGGGELLNPDRASASNHNQYIERAEALARIDGAKIIFTNISADPEERRIFWEKVEQFEPQGNPDFVTAPPQKSADFWSRIMQASDCPMELKMSLEAGNLEPFVAADGRKLEAWVKQQPGYDAGTCGMKVKLGRGGRVQQRIVAELPLELNLQQRAALLREFCGEFERRQLPFVAALHAPGVGNDNRNWHFHLDYYERPVCRLPDGRWDFEVVEEYRRPSGERRLRQKYPHNKNSEVRRKDWVAKLRMRYVEVANKHLRLANFPERFDHRSYEAMGIHKVPSEKLGTVDAPLEKAGIVTARGARNGDKDWAYQLLLTQREYDDGVIRTDNQSRQWRTEMDGVGMNSSEALAFSKRVEDWQNIELGALENLRMATDVRRHYERAQSRAQTASETFEKRLSYLPDISPQPSLAEIAMCKTQLRKATAYLDQLALDWAAVLKAAAEWSSKARFLEARSNAIATEIANQLHLLQPELVPQAQVIGGPAAVETQIHHATGGEGNRINAALERLAREPIRFNELNGRVTLSAENLRKLNLAAADLVPERMQARLIAIRRAGEREMHRLRAYVDAHPSLLRQQGTTVNLAPRAYPEMLKIEQRWGSDPQLQIDLMTIVNACFAAADTPAGLQNRLDQKGIELANVPHPPLQAADCSNPASSKTSPSKFENAATANSNPLIDAYLKIGPDKPLERQVTANAILRDPAAKNGVEALEEKTRTMIQDDAHKFVQRMEANRARALGGLSR